jgi:hypothetical protein
MNAMNAGEEGEFVNSLRNGGGGSGIVVAALEMEDEEEFESLLEETDSGGRACAQPSASPSSSRAAARLTLRKSAAAASARAARAAVSAPHRVLGLIRDRVGHHFTSRNIAAILLLAGLVVLALRIDTDLEQEHYRPEEVLPKSPHQSSFWDELPKSNVNGEEMNSIASSNWRNDVGFYWHHPYVSPYDNELYGSVTDAERKEIRAEFDARREVYGSKYGWWVHPKTQGVEYPRLDPKNDTSLAHLKPTAWQLNPQYLSEFLNEAIELVDRVHRGIYEEYGFNETTASDGHIVNKIFRAAVIPNVTELVRRRPQLASSISSGVAVLTARAWEALVRKLCHAIVTHGTFFVVTVGGDPGNRVNFARTGPMQFHYLLEPVLDMLGVRLITRNLAGMPPAIGALGGASVFGEADVLVVYDDGQLSAGEMELLQRQSILSGERVPVILGSSPDDAYSDQSFPLSEAWVGRIFSRRDVCPRTKSGKILPRAACQYLNCQNTEQRPSLCNKFEDVCWVNRTDISPSDQYASVGMTEYVSLNSSLSLLNYRQHQWEGRKLSLVVLQALNETLQRWRSEVVKGSPYLPDDMWHVHGRYRELREAVRTHRKRAQDVKNLIVGPTACEELLRSVNPMICHISMRVLTEWTPRIDPSTNRLTARVISPFFDPNAETDVLYAGFDLLPEQWRDLDRDVDVHMVAIATNESIDQFRDQTVGKDDDDNEASEDGSHGPRSLWRTHRARKGIQTTGQTPTGRNVTTTASSNSWVLYNAPIGFCDGSSQAACNRAEGNRCLLANRQFYKGGLLTSGTSDWLEITVPSVTEGVILLRFDWTMDWRLTEATPGEPRWRNRLDRLPDDFAFEYALSSSSSMLKSDVVALNLEQFRALGVQVTDDLVVYPVLMNTRMSHDASAASEQINIKLRVRTEKLFKVILTHVYYA